jgi:hypothetical protein
MCLSRPSRYLSHLVHVSAATVLADDLCTEHQIRSRCLFEHPDKTEVQRIYPSLAMTCRMIPSGRVRSIPRSVDSLF